MKDKVNEGRYGDSWGEIYLLLKDSNLEENQLLQNFSFATICDFVPSDTAFHPCSHLCFSVIGRPFSRYSPLFFTITGFSVLLYFHQQGKLLDLQYSGSKYFISSKVFLLLFFTVSSYTVHTR